MRTDTGVSEKELRHFGQLVGSIFVLIGLWPFFVHGAVLHAWAVFAGAILVILGSAAPGSLVYPYRFWVGLGHALGWLNTRIILAIIFFGLITPMGICMRVFGKRLLPRTFDPTAATYRVVRVSRPRTHMRHQF